MAETILVVDDEANYRVMLRMLLEKKGFTVLEATDGEEGIEAARRHLPDLVLMDVNMPRMKGSEALRELKEDPATCDIPVIVVSAREDADDLLSCFSLGAADYVRKVFRHEELLARISAHLSLSRLRRELVDANARLEEMNRVLMANMRYAGEIQASLLTQTFPQVDGLEIAGIYQPCEATSGDYYAAFWLDGRHLALCVADASGHGVGAAMLAVFLKAQLDNICRTSGPGIGPPRPPAEVMRLVNESLCAKNFGREFISAFYGILDLETMRIRYCNAGHPYPVVLDAGGAANELARSSTVLGVFPGTTYEEFDMELPVGATLVLYTDGLVETRNRRGEPLGEKALLHEIEMGVGLGPEELVHRLVEVVDAYREDDRTEDDVTVLALANSARRPDGAGR